ncbi:hypothetical protein C3L33_23056, partial [Rhododendron williamsianum]
MCVVEVPALYIVFSHKVAATVTDDSEKDEWKYKLPMSQIIPFPKRMISHGFKISVLEKRFVNQIYGIDAASGAAVSVLIISLGDHVFDLCAAP